MGKPIFNPIIDGFTSSIGNITFYQRDGQTFTRKRSGPTGKPTAAQNEVRESFAQASADWKVLPVIIKESWKKAALYRRGYNRFIGVNTPKYRNREVIILSEELGISGLSVLTAAPGASGTIDITFTNPESFTGEMTVFYRPVPAEGEAYQNYSLIHTPAVTSGTLSIKECSPGKEYELQAVLSDKELSQASMVSKSVSAVAKAGV